VLQTVIFRFAAMSCALVSGRAAMNGDRLYDALPAPDWLTVTAPKGAMTTGVKHTPSRITTTSAVDGPATQSSSSSKGSRMAIHVGSDHPLRRHSNHICALAGDEKCVRRRDTPARPASHVKPPLQSGTSPRRARETA